MMMATSIQSDRITQDVLSDEDVLTEGPKYNEPPRKTRWGDGNTSTAAGPAGSVSGLML